MLTTPPGNDLRIKLPGVLTVAGIIDKGLLVECRHVRRGLRHLLQYVRLCISSFSFFRSDTSQAILTGPLLESEPISNKSNYTLARVSSLPSTFANSGRRGWKSPDKEDLSEHNFSPWVQTRRGSRKRPANPQRREKEKRPCLPRTPTS